MATYDHESAGGVVCAGDPKVTPYFETGSGGVECAGLGSNFLYGEASLPGSPCTVSTPTLFCCRLPAGLTTKKRSVQWQQIDGAYVAAVTICHLGGNV